MAFVYNHNYFMAAMPTIYDNRELRLPQIEAYRKVSKYFNSEYDNRNALVVLPTGVGKTGVIGLAPYGISKGRVLIITPGTTIRETVLESLNPEDYDNFWLKRKVFNSKVLLPNVIEYLGNDTTYEVLSASNIVILNVQKLQSRLDSSLINVVPKDFFDMIIIDEAHHSTAKTWIECVNHFDNAKVLKLTGTPFRTDGEEINGDLVYKYSLSRAMHNGLVKSLENIQYIPDELKLTIDDDETKEYSINEIYQMNLRDADWITRSVAYSKSCSEKVVDESIRLLRIKLKNSNIPHKIIAIACSISHAKQICEMYKNKGLEVALIYSNLGEDEKKRIFKDIENHRVQAIVNVAMLGEGYDHPYLSIAAIFRPFRNELPYTQFIGRILRIISDEGVRANDNIGQIVAHKHLKLDSLWEKYKIEIQESEIIGRLKCYDEILDEEINGGVERGINSKGIDIGNASDYGKGCISIESYMDTEITRKAKEDDDKTKEQIKQMVAMLKVTEEQAELLLQQVQGNSDIRKRPDLAFSSKKKNVDIRIREEIIPKLIVKYNIKEDGDDLKKSSLFEGTYWYIPEKVKNRNNAMLAMYMNSYLRNKIGKARNKWIDDDMDRAILILEDLEKFIEKSIQEFYNYDIIE
ncbi:DEAD/DEAH box helicase family protein [Clostridium algidicarnis]|uniref:DEAD/DEAH box helicase n=1 Tax=Clostridium algidicarnis TaxID=37659 RepID=UPI001C0CE860|nr:DEAD/DEAH box helicase family protein [Clostridium algidicarnis]MBU3205561.1 DEAD/DEAH box helicase family protein [Clostridium algidicarnis]